MTGASHYSAALHLHLGGPFQPYGAAAFTQAGVGNPAPEGVKSSSEGIGEEGNRPPLELFKNRFAVKEGDIVRMEFGGDATSRVVEKDGFNQISVARNEDLMEGVTVGIDRSAPNPFSRQNLPELLPRLDEEVRDAAECLLLLNPRNKEPKSTRRPRSARIARSKKWKIL